MKRESKSPWGATLYVLAAVGCLIGGAFVREQAQHGSIDWENSISHEALLASNEETPPVSESTNFRDLADKLHTFYVEPFDDDMKLATGAVKGMVSSLEDPLASYMNKDQFNAFVASQAGTFEGIGVEVNFQYSEKAQATRAKQNAKKDSEDTVPAAGDEVGADYADLVPDVVVTAVVPGGPADRAGIRPGDVVDSIDGRWILSSKQIKRFRDENKRIRDSKLSDAEIDKQLRELNERAKEGTTPAKARDLLSLGVAGEVEVKVTRGESELKFKIARAKTKWPAVMKQADGSFALRLFTGVEDQIDPILEASSAPVLDLRNSTLGNFDVLNRVLDRIAPAGEYGVLSKLDGTLVSKLKSAGTGKAPSRLTLIVDKTTRGAAEVLALALNSTGFATLQGDPKMAGERAVIRASLLPDGSGYTIPIATYAAKAPEVKK